MVDGEGVRGPGGRGVRREFDVELDYVNKVRARAPARPPARPPRRVRPR
jgi:hypothetical protein